MVIGDAVVVVAIGAPPVLEPPDGAIPWACSDKVV
jgi:hypothetical protein